MAYTMCIVHGYTPMYGIALLAYITTQPIRGPVSFLLSLQQLKVPSKFEPQVLP
jgi:hypothetical protein